MLFLRFEHGSHWWKVTVVIIAHHSETFAYQFQQRIEHTFLKVSCRGICLSFVFPVDVTHLDLHACSNITIVSLIE